MPLAWSHQRVKRLRRLLARRNARWAERVFVLEGPELLAVALDAGAPVESVYLAPGARAAAGVAEAVDRAYEAGARIFDLAPGVLERVADTVTPQPVLAVAGFGERSVPDLAGARLVVVCVDIRDPGNAGTVIRSADAAGADGVVCCDGTVDPYNPKTVRSSAGSVFHLPVIAGGSATELLDQLGPSGIGLRRLGAVARGGEDHASVDWTQPVAIVLGNEAHGLPDEIAASLEGTVTIELAGRAESLNVGVAGAVLCFEALRQRRLAGHPDRSTMPDVDRAGDRAEQSNTAGSGR